MPDQDDETLAEAFWSVARRIRHLTHDSVTPLGITPGHARAIGVLRRHGGMRPSDLAHHPRIAPRSATEVVDALVDRGLAQRAPDPEDRRAIVVTLTADGERVGHEVRSARAQGAEAVFGGLSPADRDALGRILRSLRS